MNPKVSIVKCQDYSPDLVFQSTKKAVDLLGGITSFIRPGSRVLIKPNLLMAKEPELGITTHPQVVRAVVRLLKEINCSIYLGDGPSVWGAQKENIDNLYEKTGMKKLSDEEGINLVKFDNKRWRGKFPLAAWLDNCDCFISIPKFKTHELTLLTGAIKNLFGLVWEIYKTELHKQHYAPEEFAKILVDIYQEAKPALTIVDGIVAMEGDGPATSGKLCRLGLLFAGSDGVALDTILADVMGIEPLAVFTTKEAVKRGMGTGKINSIQICGENLEDVRHPFLLPSASRKKKIPQPLIKIAARLINFYPKLNHQKCTRCSACVIACPKKIISLKAGRIVIDYSGCISCFCCQESCPAAAITVKKSILAKVLGL